MTWGDKNVNHGYWSVPSKTAIKKVPFWELIGSVGQLSGTAVRTLAESTECQNGPMLNQCTVL